MYERSYIEDTDLINRSLLRIPKVIAKITICGALTLEVREDMGWNPPTPEQIKNLKEMLNIDVKLMGETNDEEK